VHPSIQIPHQTWAQQIHLSAKTSNRAKTMKPLIASTIAVWFSFSALHAASTPSWPQFRGPNASGVNEDAKPPVHFGPDTNLLWKVSLPPGLSAPVVWGDWIFLTALEHNELLTLGFDAQTGRELWRRVAPAQKIESCHAFSSPAASTPCTDGGRVYSYFGSFGVLAYEFDGREVWHRPFARLPSNYGTATSPILAGGHLILQRDGDSADAQLIALDPATGQTAWESSRSLAGACYSTPMVWRHDGTEELMVQGKGRVAAYGLDGSGPKWWVRGWGFTAVTTPVASDGLLLVGGSGLGDPSAPPDPMLTWTNLITYDANQDGKLALEELPADLIWHIRKEIPQEVPGNSFKLRFMLGRFVDANRDKIITREEWEKSEAFNKSMINADRFVGVRPGGKDDSTETHVAWGTTKGLSEMPSALFYRGRVHFIRDGGMWTVIDPRTGRCVLDRERLGIGGQAVASPVAADGRIYVVNESGTFAVLRAGDSLEVLAVNKLGESVRATPALAGERIYVRSAGHLWAFGERPSANR
jgi:outer membrane protein assembly factor BamB